MKAVSQSEKPLFLFSSAKLGYKIRKPVLFRMILRHASEYEDVLSVYVYMVKLSNHPLALGKEW